MKYSIIFPAYNEAATIATALVETQKVFVSLGESFEIIVVDDGSQDETSVITQAVRGTRSSVRLITLTQNGGKGKAVCEGVKAACGEILLFLDCDLSVHPRQFLSFIPSLSQADVLIGSRRLAGSRIVVSQPWYRVGLGRLFNFCIRQWLDIPFADTQCGFKVFQAKAAQQIFSNMLTYGWVFDVEVILHAQKLGFRIKELPVDWKNGRESRVRFRDAWLIVRELWLLSRFS